MSFNQIDHKFTLLLLPLKKVMFKHLTVCELDQSESYELILMKSCESAVGSLGWAFPKEHMIRFWLDFGGNPESLCVLDRYPGFLSLRKQGISYHHAVYLGSL